MTLREAIDMVDDIKPNAFDDVTKVYWLNSLEGRICLDVFLMTIDQAEEFIYEHPGDLDTAMLARHPHHDIYVEWLKACIDEANGEYGKYSNTMAIFNAKYRNYVAWFARYYAPAQGNVQMDSIALR